MGESEAHWQPPLVILVHELLSHGVLLFFSLHLIHLWVSQIRRQLSLAGYLSLLWFLLRLFFYLLFFDLALYTVHGCLCTFLL
jgi:hypothetical protein